MKRLIYPFSVTKVTANHFLFTLFIIILSIEYSFALEFFIVNINNKYTEPDETDGFVFEETITMSPGKANKLGIIDPVPDDTTAGYLELTNFTDVFWLNEYLTTTTEPPERNYLFKCFSKSFSIEPHLVCDGINDCDDGSDELSCPTFNDPTFNEPTFDCAVCECPPSYEPAPGPCYCCPAPKKDAEDKLCEVEDEKAPLVVFSTLNALFAAKLPCGRAKIQSNEMLHRNLSFIDAFHYNARDNYLIWLDKTENKIFTAKVYLKPNHLNEIYGRRLIKDAFQDSNITEFFFDWSKSYIFWFDEYGFDVEKIDKVFFFPIKKANQHKLDGRISIKLGPVTMDVMRQCIFRAKFGIRDNPSAIDRYDLGDTRINMHRIVGTDLLSPVGLAVDTEYVKLYWIDGLKGTLNSVAYDGTNRITLYNNLPYMNQVISMDIFSNYLYFTNNINNTIDRININGAVSKVDTLLSVPDGSPTYVKIVQH